MKKIFLFFSILFLTLSAQSQFTNTTWIGNAQTQWGQTGALGAGYGLQIRFSFPDTLSANNSSIGGTTGFLKNIKGFIIRVGDDIYCRSEDLQKWNKINVASSGGTVTSVGLSMPSAFTVTNSPVTGAGTLTVTGAGTVNQYIRGDGTLATYTGGIATASNGLTLTGTNVKFGGTLIEETTIDGGGFDFFWNNTDNFVINTTGSFGSSSSSGGLSTTLSNSGSSISLQASSGSGNSFLRVAYDSINILPHLGNFIIDTLVNNTAQNTLMGWVQTAGGDRGEVGYITLGSGLSLASGVLSNSGIVSTPTWQQTLTAGSTLTGSNTVNGGNFDYIHNNNNTVQLVTGSGSITSRLFLDAGGNAAELTSQTTAGNSGLSVHSTQGVSFTPHLGNLFIDTLTNVAARFVLHYNPATGKVTYADTTASASGANTALSNLASVAINTSLISDANNTDDLGTAALTWRTGYFGTSVFTPLAGIGTTSMTAVFKADIVGTTTVLRVQGANYSTSTLSVLDPDGTTGYTNGGFTVFSTPAYMNANSSYISLQTGGVERWRIAASTGNFSNTGGTGTAYIHLKAGTTAASTAPLKFTSGSLNTTAEAGAMEFLTDKWYGTITTGAARKEFTLNNASLTSGTTPVATTNGRLTDGLILASGTYAATISSEANCTATPIGNFQYLRVGNTVTVSGAFNIDPTLTATTTAFRLDLPITSSNFSGDENAGGTAWCPAIAGMGAGIKARAGDVVVEVVFISTDINANDMYFSFTYQIIP